ncbi:MAG: NAD-dependent deacylase [Bacteroidaceae bacterium]|nr:NAD-dependent deacylase [Bacteroidaceae bacterium]
MKHIVFLTGAGISVESGLSTFRGANGLWNNHKIEDVCTIEAWEKNPNYVNAFYNDLRKKLPEIMPNKAHHLVADLEKSYQVTVITQNVDDLHERAGSSHVIHLHGELLKACSSRNKDDQAQWVTLDHENLNIPINAKAADGSRLRPYIVWFGEDVPLMEKAIEIVEQADVLVIIGTSLNVYPAANLINFAHRNAKVIIINPDLSSNKPDSRVWHICKKATDGMVQLLEYLKQE